MKTYLFFSIALLIVINSFGQIGQNLILIDTPEKGDNTIKIKTDSIKKVNLLLFGEYLISKGYTLEKVDESFMTILTGSKNSQNNKGKASSLSHKLNISCRDNEIIVRATIQIPAFPSMELVYIDWDFLKSKGSFNYMHWYNNFKPVLEGYPNALEIEYLKE